MELSLNCLATSRGEEPETVREKQLQLQVLDGSIWDHENSVVLLWYYCPLNMLASIQNFENKAQEISTKDT